MAEQVSAFPVVVRLKDSVPGLNAGMSAEVTVEEPLIGGGGGFLVPLSVLAPEGGKDLHGVATIFLYDKGKLDRQEAQGQRGRRARQPAGRHERPRRRRPRRLGRCLLPGRRAKSEASSTAGVGAVDFLTRFGLARSRFTITVMVALLVAGLALYPDFPKREDPVVVIRTAVVSALFPGLAPERMENLVAIPIERKVRELAEVKDIRTLADRGVARRLRRPEGRDRQRQRRLAAAARQDGRRQGRPARRGARPVRQQRLRRRRDRDDRDDGRGIFIPGNQGRRGRLPQEALPAGGDRQG